MFKNRRVRKFNYKGGKMGTIPLYSKKNVMEEKGNKIR
jgi:hypothetical protein